MARDGLATWFTRLGILGGALVATAGLMAPPVADAATAGIAENPAVLSTTTASANWSGYAATGATFDSVSASWVEPSATCTSKTSYAAFWAGLDGYSDKTVEQTGSEMACIGGSPEYVGWYEMYPAGPIEYSNPVKPGDDFTASVTASGDSFTLTLSDITQGWTRTATKTLASAKKASAEVIAEAPCCTASDGILPLADFGKVQFNSAEANGAAIGSSNPVRIDMVPHGGPNTDHTSALSGGEAFTVTWKGN